MDSLVEFRTDGGANVVIEVDDEGPGLELVARGDGSIVQAGRTFEHALQGIHSAAESALNVFRDGRLKPDSVEIEFGVKLTTEAGAVIAKSSLEGHLVVKLSWKPERHRPVEQGPEPDGHGSDGEDD